MKKNIYIICTTTLLFIFLSFNFTLLSQQKDNLSWSKQLIDHFNLQRKAKSFPIIEHDTILDNITNEILLKREKYKNSKNDYNKDSIRQLFYNRGVIDYEFDIMEISNKNTNKIFNDFLAKDSSSNIRMGIAKSAYKHLFVKTKSYLRYNYGVFIHPLSIINDGMNINTKKNVLIKSKNDSVKYFVKQIISDKYFYYYSPSIPSTKEAIGVYEKFEAIPNKNPAPMIFNIENNYPDLVLISSHPDMFLIVTNKKNEIVAILK